MTTISHGAYVRCIYRSLIERTLTCTAEKERGLVVLSQTQSGLWDKCEDPVDNYSTISLDHSCGAPPAGRCRSHGTPH